MASWKLKIIQALHERDKLQTLPFEKLINDYSYLSDKNVQLLSERNRLSSEMTTLKKQTVEVSHNTDQRVFNLQDELMEVHRQKGKLATDVIELNRVVQEKDKVIHTTNLKLADLETTLRNVETTNLELCERLHTAEHSNKMLLNELAASREHNETAKLKARELEDDRHKLIKQLDKVQKEVENLKNIEYDIKYQKNKVQIQKQLAEAASLSVDEPYPTTSSSMFILSLVPKVAVAELNAHEGEVNSVRYAPSGQLFATGGSDRKLKLWSLVSGRYELTSTLVGCNAALNAIDFDANESVVLGASSDFSCRIWTLRNSRLKVNLTGHSDKVVSAKFRGNAKRAVTVSADRTIKLWDVQQCHTTRTIPTGSNALDVLSCSPNGVIITGHFDHKIRIWDERSGEKSDEILLSEKITGIDLSPDFTQVLACTRANKLEIVNLRMRNVEKQFTANDFNVGLNYVRPCFSPHGKYVVAGSGDGRIYIWDVDADKLEECLQGHQNIVVACHWNPSGHSLVSCERMNKVIVWDSSA